MPCRPRRVHAALLTALFLTTTSLSAQPSTRRAASLASLASHSGFYHQRPIVTVGNVSLTSTGHYRISADEHTLAIIFSDGGAEGPSEVRGQLWDLGRMSADDPRLAQYDLQSTFQLDPDDPWPRPGDVVAIIASAVAPASPPLDASVRGLVLFPKRYRDQRVTVTGQFAGSNLLGDLPDAPSNSRWDFVIRSADAAIWVSNIRPRGDDFELSLDARIDTGRWVEVTGTVQEGRGLQWIDAERNTFKIVRPPTETAASEPVRVPMGPPPEVVFSTPIGGETEVETTARVRIQFSRDIDPSTVEGRVRVSYVSAGNAAPMEFSTRYRAAARVLEVDFSGPLEPLQAVRVELTDGIQGTDEQPLEPWTLEFETGSP